MPCKFITMNKTRNVKLKLNEEEMEEVSEHSYLGTLVSRNGERVSEMKKRISQSKSVANEIVQICKLPEMSSIRLKYVKMLINTCLDSKIKYGCALWKIHKSSKIRDDLDRIKPNILKRVLEVPNSTPAAAIQYEFGINNLSFDISMEKIILAIETMKRNDNRITKQLLKSCMEMKMPGFCNEVFEICENFKIDLDELMKQSNVRNALKKIMTKIQHDNLLTKMLLSSKMSKIILYGFQFNGKCKRYVKELDFNDARAVFMARYRMLPTKTNFPGRWTNNLLCNICGKLDVDEHIFTCPGYKDIIDNDIKFDMLWNKDILENMEMMKRITNDIKKWIKRMEEIQELKI